MSVPSEYDLTQDALIAPMRDILLTAAEPPSGPEFSYPVVDQAVSSSMWSWITLGMGSGILDAGGRPYWLTSLDNATNTATLTPSTTIGTANALIRGFFHQLSESLTVSLPMPSSGTITYHVCLTYDPREESSAGGPISVQTYSGEPPSTHGRHHIVLWTVRRTANQLLTDAEVQTVRPKVTPRIAADSLAAAPDPSSQLWGTVLFVADENAEYRAYGSSEAAGGPTSWRPLTARPWVASTSSGYVSAGGSVASPGYRVVGDRVELRGRIRRSNGSIFYPNNAYNIIPNAPTPSVGTAMNSGSDSSRHPLQCARAAGGTLEIYVKHQTPWVDLAGCFYYLR